MDIIKAIIQLGTEAVLQYRTISHQQDDDMPEAFLGAFVAPRLCELFHCPVHIEHHYTTIAEKLGAPITTELKSRIGNFRADVAMYQEGLPPVVVEFKILDEKRQPASVARDIRKIQKLAEEGKLRAYVGVVICEKTTVSLEARISELQKFLDQQLHTGDPQRSANGEWRWCFGCASLSETLEASASGGAS